MAPPAPTSNVALSPPAAWSRRFALILAALTLGGLALRLFRLGAQSLWIDEVLSIGWIEEIDRNGYGALLGDLHGPLHALLIDAMARLSTSEAALRLPSALAGAATVPALGLLGRALWGERVGLVAAALACLSPFALYYAQECRNYALTILFAVTSMAAALAFVRQPRPGRAAWLAASELLGIASNLNGLFFAVGLNAWLVASLRRRRGALGLWLAAHVGLGLVLMPYAWHTTHQVRPERLVGVETDFGEDQPLRGATTLHPMAVPYTAFAFAAGYSLGPTLDELRRDAGAAAAPRHLPALGLVLVGFGVPLLVGLASRRPPQAWWLVMAPALVTLLFTVWLAFTNMKPYNVRYLSVALPAFLLLVAVGLVRLPWRAHWVAAACAAAVALWSCFNYHFVARYGRDDVRGVVDWVAQHAAPEDAIVQISLSGPLLHYYDRLGTRWTHPPDAVESSAAAAEAFVDEVVAGRGGAGPGRVWYLECRPEALDPQGHLRRALEGRASAAVRRDFTGIRLYRYDVRRSAGAS